MDAKNCLNGLSMLLDKYDINNQGEYVFLVDDLPALMVANNPIPLLPWRQDKRMKEIKNMRLSGQVGEPSVYRATRIVENTKKLDAEIKRELDLCEWIMESPVATIYMVENDRAANIIAKLENEVVCTLEIATTLNVGEADINRHEINTRRGVISDYVVDTQINQQSVYLFGENKDMFYDTDFELFGLDYYEITTVRSAFAMLSQEMGEEYKQRGTRLTQLLEAAKESNKQQRRIYIN